MNRDSDEEQVKESSLAAFGLAAGAGHLLANLGFKGARAAGAFARANPGKVTGLGRRFAKAVGTRFNTAQANQISRGIRNARAGKPQGFWSRAAETWIAPEFQGGTHIGRKIGTNLRNVSTPKAQKALANLSGQLKKNPKFTESAPWMPQLKAGLDQAVKQGLPEVGKVQKPGLLNRIGAQVVGAPAAVLDPGLLGHVAMNRGRIALSHSGIGRAMMKRQAVTGVGRATGAPSTVSRTAREVNSAIDYLVSPAVRDPSRVAESITTLAKQSPRRARNLAEALRGVGGKGSDFTHLTQGGSIQNMLSGLANKNQGILRQLSSQYRNHANPQVRTWASRLRSRLGPSAVVRRTNQAASSAGTIPNLGRWILPAAGAAGGARYVARTGTGRVTTNPQRSLPRSS